MSLVKDRWIEPFSKTTGGSRSDLDAVIFFVIFGVKVFLNIILFPLKLTQQILFSAPEGCSFPDTDCP
jgi:hypothetical protein